MHKSYVFSTVPNYKYSARSNDNASLTDGIYTSGNFWTSSTTVGWQGEKEVTITIDLKREQNIGTVTFNTVRNIASKINFPQNIFVFISDDNSSFEYVGDAADSPDNVPGNYEVKKFSVDNVNRAGRYVVIKIIPQGSYIFCDEIEVTKGENGNSSMKNSIALTSLTKVTDSLKDLGYRRRTLLESVSSLENSLNEKGNTEKRFIEDLSKLNQKTLSNNDLGNIKKTIAIKHASILKEKFNASFVLEKYNPWDSLEELREPKGNTNLLNYQFFIAKNNAEYGAFVITNSDSTPQKIAFKVLSNSSISAIELYRVVYVAGPNFRMLPDPLLKVGNYLTVNPGISQMFIFKINGIKSGTSASKIIVSSSEKSDTINIKARILNLFKNEKFEELNANVWAYFNHPMLKYHNEEVAKDLESHHINTLVIPPDVMPKMETTDFTDFTNYLSKFKEAKNILLSIGYSSISLRNGYKGGIFMSDEWKNRFIQWYSKVKNIIEKTGSANPKIYLYPYDEVQINNIADFKSLILWARKAVPGIKFYATINNKAAVDSILPLVDIAQIIPSLGGMDKLPPHQGEIWVYGANTPSVALSPYGYYRLMAWDAFIKDYKGIGFWNYADERNGNVLNLISDILPNPAGSFSVIYNDTEGNIISSRRWEAFRLGIEDYSILELYAKKFGISKAKELAEKVMSEPNSIFLADKIKAEMVQAL
ncbi:MAG: discoidin domain-containing protein [Ferruginibacter sp.]